MQETTAQSQQESQKTRARVVLFWKPFYKKKNMRAFNVARPRQRNIYQITSPTTCNLHANRQASELRLNSFFISTTLLSFEQLIHLNYFIWRWVGWWRDGFWVAKLPGGEMTGYRDNASDRDNKAPAYMYTYTYDTHLPPLYQKIEKIKIERWAN